MSSSSSSAGSQIANIGEIDRMDEDSPLRSVAVPEGPIVPTSSERPKTSASPVYPTGKEGEKNSAPQFENQCALDAIMADRYSPTASGNSRSQPTSGNGVDETPTGRRPSGNHQAQHTIGSPPDQAASATKTTGGPDHRPLSFVGTPHRSTGRLSISYDGSSSEDRCWRHEVNAIRDTNQNAMYGPAHSASPPPADGDGAGRQAPNAGGNRADGRPSVNSPSSAPAGIRNRAGRTGRSGGNSSHQTTTVRENPPRPSVTVQNLQRVQNILNTSNPALAETPGFVQLIGQVSEILQQTMQRTEAYREQRNSQSHTMTSSQRSSLSRGQHGRVGGQPMQRPPRRFPPGSHEGRRLFQEASPSHRREELSLGHDDLRHHLNQASGRRRQANVHDRIGATEFRLSNLRSRSPTDYNPAPFQRRRHESITGCRAFSAGLQAVRWPNRF